MRTWRLLASSALALALAASACGDREVTRLARVKDRVCACKDVACAEAAMQAVPHGEGQASHREQEIARDMLDCLAHLYETAPLPTGSATAGSAAAGSAAALPAP